MKVVEIAKQVLEGAVDPVEGCRQMVALQYVELNESQQHDPDFLMIVTVESETDDLPTSRSRHLWDDAALERMDQRKAAYLLRRKDAILSACRAIVEKFG